MLFTNVICMLPSFSAVDNCKQKTALPIGIAMIFTVLPIMIPIIALFFLPCCTRCLAD